MTKSNSYMSDVVLIMDAMVIHKATICDTKSKSNFTHFDSVIVLPEAEDNLKLMQNLISDIRSSIMRKTVSVKE